MSYMDGHIYQFMGLLKNEDMHMDIDASLTHYPLTCCWRKV